MRAVAGVAAGILVPFPFGFGAIAIAEKAVRDNAPECNQGETEYEKCASEFGDVENCKTKYRAKCSVYVYQRDDNISPCTSSVKECKYDREAEGVYRVERGLPVTGFCPECAGSSCTLKKSTKTFQVAQAGSRMHVLSPSSVSDGDQLGTNAVYMRVSLGTLGSVPVQCGLPSACGVGLTRAVEVRRGLFACVPCLAAATTQCVGEHGCGFGVDGRISLAEAYATVVQTWTDVIRAGVGVGGVEPVWLPWLEPRGFEEFNPVSVGNGFNQAILRLNGQCSRGGVLPDVSKCQNDGTRRALAAHVDKEYRVAEAAVVPGGFTLTWPVSRALLTTTNIPAWEAEARASIPFVKGLLSESVCGKFAFESMVCLQRSDTTYVFNPLIAGDFEVQEGCDTALVDSTRVISSACNQMACSSRTLTSDGYNMFRGTDPTDAFAWTACKRRDRATPGFFTTPGSVATNLCSKAPDRPKVCKTAQGVLERGSAWKPSSVADLYVRGDASVLQTMTLAELVAYKVGRNAPPNLAVSAWDMGGHYIRLALTSEKRLVVKELPLRSFSSLAQARVMNATGWAYEWANEARSKAGVFEGKSATCGTWACPFRRRSYWSGTGGAAFRPSVPDPARTNAIFGTAVHPASRTVPLSGLGSTLYVTRNGFCVCKEGGCSAAYGAVGGNCSRSELVAALSDGLPRSALVLAADVSRAQLDWPWSSGVLRDGSYLNRSADAPVDGVLDRLPAFRYRFVSVRQKIPQPGTSTLDEGGDCHMGRAVRSDALPDPSCVVIFKSATEVRLRCAGGVVRTMQRPLASTLISEAETRRVKVPCSKCSAPPSFFVNNKTLAEPETSYGTLWKWSPSRLLARDLRFRLCGNASECGASAGWTMDSFWRKMKAGTLFKEVGGSGLTGQFAEARLDLGTDDAARWAEPWLLCTITGATARSPGKKTCSGSIDKVSWQAGDRTSLCRAVLRQPNADQAGVDLSICDLDANMSKLCSVVQGARYRVFEANCRITGRCRTTAFFYQPATYSLDDSAFVRSTVGRFYNFTAAGSCPVTDEETAAVLESNARAVQLCPAQDLQAFAFAIEAARAVVHFFVKIGYYMGVIGLQLLSLVGGGDSSGPLHVIMTYFNLILSEFQSFFATLGDVVYKMVMETGKLGKFIKDTVTAICYFLRDVYMAVVQPYICMVKSTIVVLLDTVASIIDGISYVVGGALGGAVKSVQAARDSVDAADVCDKDSNPFSDCDGLFPDDDSPPTSLPMPTRCWVGYQPTIGDQGGLSCTAADTCMEDDGTLRACASCEGGGSSFGCDSLTKLCRFVCVYCDPHERGGHVASLPARGRNGIPTWRSSLVLEPWVKRFRVPGSGAWPRGRPWA